MSDTVSIIVPVYNTEEYLRQCIDSICNQTYRNLDIILITEKCDDNSERVCDELAALDDRIRVIHKNTISGVSRSRNIGLKSAKGDYILFVDSDDYIHADRVEKLLEELKRSKADVLMTGKTLLEDGVLQPMTINAPVGTRQSFPDAFKYILGSPYERRFLGYVWALLISTEKIKQPNGSIVLFDEGLNHSEDIHWIIRVLLNCKDVYFSEDTTYVYRRDRAGNTRDLMYNAKSLKYANSAIQAYTDIYYMYRKNDIKYEGNIYFRIIEHKIRAFRTAVALESSIAKQYSHNIIPMIGHYVLSQHSYATIRWGSAIMYHYIKYVLSHLCTIIRINNDKSKKPPVK